MADVYSRPSSSFGYWRGGGSEIPLAGGQGSMAGQANSGVGLLAQGQGMMNGSNWNPTIVYLLVLIIAEMIVFGFIAKALR